MAGQPPCLSRVGGVIVDAPEQHVIFSSINRYECR